MKERPEPPLVFVYGTLKRGYSNYPLMVKAGGQWVGKAKTTCSYPLLLGEYPFLLDRPGEGEVVHGELYQVDQIRGWELLDELECHPTMYRRRVEPVLLEGEGNINAWVYYLVDTSIDLGGLDPVGEYREQI